MKSIISTIILTIAFVISSFGQGLKPGDKAGDFSLKNVDGKMVSLKDYNLSKGVIVIFTCNHCPFSKMYESRIITLNNIFISKGFPVIAINSNDSKSYPDDSPENMIKVSKEKKYTFPYLIDETQEIAKFYGATKTPHVFLLQNQGNSFSVEYVGAIDDNAQDEKLVKDKFLENAIQEILLGKMVTQKTTKAIGCGIKWKM